MLLEQGIERVKLTDFGLARAADDASLTKSGVIAGTPQYMSPEQARGESVDQRSDLFSLGSVLYAMCTGRSPFRAETSYGVLRRITDDEPKPIREINPEIPEWLCRIISWLMSKDTDSRIQTAEELAKLLEECLAHIQQPTVVSLPESLLPLPKATFFSKFLRPRVLTAVAVLGFGLLAFPLWQATAPTRYLRPMDGRRLGAGHPRTNRSRKILRHLYRHLRSRQGNDRSAMVESRSTIPRNLGRRTTTHGQNLGRVGRGEDPRFLDRQQQVRDQPGITRCRRVGVDAK